jgi:hypothetical protein
MKKIFTTAALATLGVAGLRAQTPLERSYYAPAPALSVQERTKWWSVSAALRGFYDDNYSYLPSGFEQDSWGFEVAPSLSINLPFEQSYLQFNYTYSLRYYEGREDEEIDQAHVANVLFTHAFTTDTKLEVKNSFVYAIEPEVLEPGVITNPIGTRRRSDLENLRNRGNINFNTKLTETFGTALGYENTYYDYQQEGAGSYSAILDRMEHLGRFDLRWQSMPSTVPLLGYQYGMVDYSSDESLVFGQPYVPGTVTDPETRNSRSHYAYLGVEHTFSGQLNASLRAGAQLTDFPDANPEPDDLIKPYVDASMVYNFAEESAFQFGVRHALNATDVAVLAAQDQTATLNQSTTTTYGVLSHKLTPRLTGSLLGQWQYSEFNGGSADGEVDNLYLVGLNFNYMINEFLAAEAGYNFDRLDSDLDYGGFPRSFSRNRVYIGIRGTY